jgi:site-specific recombinase XerD
MFDPASVRFTGPLQAFAPGFWAELRRLGYATFSAVNLLRLAAHVSRWLATKQLEVSELTEVRVAAFAAHRRRLGYTQFLTPHALRPLLTYLRELGVAPPSSPPAIVSPLDVLLAQYADHLVRERGIGASTVKAYGGFARRFLSMGPHADWSRLTPQHITRFVLRQFRRRGVSFSKQQVTPLRSLLRFLHLRGEIQQELASCVPGVASWRLATLPAFLTAAEVSRLWSSCGSTSAIDRRDAAIVRLLVRLGLRACEVATLRFEDVDWRSGEIVVSGKGRVSRLPLPADVGRAIAGYLRHARPRSTSRHVFVGNRAPFDALTSGGITGAAARVMRRAGVTHGGSHQLRPTAAAQMLQRGASLPEIGHVLRHRRIDTTAIYAKVDFDSLRTVIQPWPGATR